MPFTDAYYTEKLQAEVESEVKATIKLVMCEMERLASLPPDEAVEPVTFNRSRQIVIRKLWNLSKECIRYGSVRSVQRN